MNSVIKVLAFFLFVGAIIIPLIVNSVRQNKAKGAYFQKVKKSTTLILCGIALALFVMSDAFVIIPTGYTGVRLTFGQVDEKPVPNGFNWKIPFVQEIARVNNKQQDIVFSDKLWSETRERTTVYYDNVTVTYQISSDKSAWIYANVSDYDNSLVSSSLVASAIKSSSKTLSDTDATNRSLIEPLAQKNIQASLDEKYGPGVVYVNKVVINNADFEESYNEAIAAKQKAQLEAEEQAIINQRNIDKAKAEAEAKTITAEAEAKVKLIEAQATADANALLEQSLTDRILRQMYINTWDGKLPVYMSGDNASLLLELTGDK